MVFFNDLIYSVHGTRLSQNIEPPDEDQEMKPLIVNIFVFVVCSLAAASFAFADDLVIVDPIDRIIISPPSPNMPEYVQVRRIDFAGSGCPAGSVAANISPDFKSITVFWDSFIAEVGPDVPLKEKRKNCALAIDLEYPQGWTYSLFSAGLRGYASLDRGVNARIDISYYFQGNQSTARFKSWFNGPIDQTFHVSDRLGVSSVIWAPCGATRALITNYSVSLDKTGNRNGTGLISVDPFDDNVRSLFDLQWRRCP